MNAIVRTTNQLAKIFNKNSPTILTGLGVAGLITTVILAVKATPKAIKIIDKAKYEVFKDNNRPEDLHKRKYEEILSDPTITLLSPWEVIELTWKCYIPTVVMGATTIACIIGSNSINLRRNAALASLYTIADTTLHEYQAKVVEQLGEKKEEKIRDDIAQDKLNKDPIEKRSVIITGKGDMLCYDSYSGRYFKNDIENLRKIQNDFNQRLINGEYDLKLNELYFEFGLEMVPLGDQVGWSTDNMLDISFGAKIATDGQPAIVVTFRNPPKKMWM